MDVNINITRGIKAPPEMPYVAGSFLPVMDAINDIHAHRNEFEYANTPYNREYTIWLFNPREAHNDFLERTKNACDIATIEYQGELVKCRTRQITPVAAAGGTRRPILQFTNKARKNMLETVSRIDWHDNPAQFVTLTYHENMQDAQEAKRHLRAFLKRLYYDHGTLPVLWRLEAQKRGAWHWHLIIWSLPYISKEDILKDWRAITGDETITQIDIQPVRSAKKARSYVAKYVGKKQENNELLRLWLLVALGVPAWQIILYLDYPTNSAKTPKPGRFWGIENRKYIRWAQLVVMSIAQGATFNTLKRYARKKWHGVNKNARVGYSIFVSDVRQWYRLFATHAALDLAARFCLWQNHKIVL